MKSILLLALLLLTSRIQAGAEISDGTRGDKTEEEKKIIKNAKDFKAQRSWKEDDTPYDQPDNKKSVELKISELNTSKPLFADCSEKLPEINLESNFIHKGSSVPGPFFGVPHENQDGYGTCYAHSARNMVLAATGGKVSPSVYDLATNFTKVNVDRMLDSGLNDGGFTCATVNAALKTSFCDQSHSPLEKGEIPPILEFLKQGNSNEDVLKTYYEVEKTTSITEKERVMGESVKKVNRLLENFLSRSLQTKLATYQDKMTPIDKSLTKFFHDDTKALVELMNKHPAASLHLPVLKKGFPDLNQVKAAATISRDQEQMIRSQRARFEWDLRKAIADGKTKVELLKLKESYFNKPEFSMISSFLTDEAFQSWYDGVIDGKFLNANKNSINFYREMMNLMSADNRSALMECSDYQFKEFSTLVGDMKNVLNMLSPAVADQLLVGRSLGSTQEVLAGLYTPGCLLEKNRQKIPGPANCTQLKSGDFGHDKSRMNKLILSNLTKGKAIGYDVRGHAMTLVGMRFNATTKSCDYLVRDSSTAGSSWTQETKFFEELRSLHVIDL